MSNAICLLSQDQYCGAAKGQKTKLKAIHTKIGDYNKDQNFNLVKMENYSFSAIKTRKIITLSKPL